MAFNWCLAWTTAHPIVGIFNSIFVHERSFYGLDSWCWTLTIDLIIYLYIFALFSPTSGLFPIGAHVQLKPRISGVVKLCKIQSPFLSGLPGYTSASFKFIPDGILVRYNVICRQFRSYRYIYRSNNKSHSVGHIPFGFPFPFSSYFLRRHFRFSAAEVSLYVELTRRLLSFR